MKFEAFLDTMAITLNHQEEQSVTDANIWKNEDE